MKALFPLTYRLRRLLLIACAFGASALHAQGITANNDSTSMIVGLQGSFNIRANDIAPTTTVYSLQPSPPPLPQCVNAQVSPAGTASYTAPVNVSAKCTVVSAACPAGSPSTSTACQMSTLTVTASAGIGQTMTSTITIQPRTDSFSVNAGQATNVNTASNDTMPLGSAWFLMSSTCTPAPVMSSNGMLAVSGPSPAGTSCTAIYKACKGGVNLPLPNPDCGTATVFISSPTTQNTSTLTVTFAANTDTVTVAPGMQGTFNVLGNDVVPQGATVSLGSGSTCAGAAISSTGIASYTAPASAGSSCTVVYQICAAMVTSPALVCRTATLIVTAQTTNPTTSTFSLKTDTASITAGQTGQTNVMRNDTYPSGSTSSLGSGSTCVGASINNIGIVTYTGPAVGTTCTVVYKVCTPATAASASVCQTSTLIVTGLPAKPPTVRDSNLSFAGKPDSFNVAANDGAPLGTGYFIESSNCPNTSITAAGAVSYTAPLKAGDTCTVIYLACPAGITPPSAFCSAEKLVVTAR